MHLNSCIRNLLVGVFFAVATATAARADVDVTVTGPIDADETVVATNSITTSGSVVVASDLHVTFAAGARVELAPGFSTNHPARFEAVVPPVVIVDQPQSLTVTAGNSASFSVTAGGSGSLSYQWFKDGSSLSGANGTSLTIASVAESDAGSYTVVVTNSLGSATSTAAVLTVVVPSFYGGSGTAADPYQIATPQQLDAVRSFPGKYFVLVADIDLNGIVFQPISNNNNGWFVGTFNGQGHAISNWSFETTEPDWAGLFSKVYGQIVNLHLENCSLSLSNTTQFQRGGLLVGLNGGTIANCSVSGQISAINGQVGGLAAENTSTIVACQSSATVYGYIAGGLVGENDSTILASSSTGSVGLPGAGWSTGGFVGQNWGEIRHCYATGEVAGDQEVGGFIGEEDGSTQYCYATGSVSGNDQVGGFVGADTNEITDCYASGATVGNSAVGGFSGSSSGYGFIARCYSYGAVAGNTEVGGLMGHDDDPTNTVTESYWDTETSGQTSSAGGTSESTSSMKDQGTYVGWDFESIWSIGSGEYPTFLHGLQVAPVIAVQPASQAVALGGTVTLSVQVVGGGPYTYQWSLWGEPILGATNDTLTITEALPERAGPYTVTIANAMGSVDSDEANLEVQLPAVPVIFRQPRSEDVYPGTQTVLSVQAYGEGDLSYQWYKDGVMIDGQTDFRLYQDDAEPGSYTVVVSNANGATTSEVVTVTVESSVGFDGGSGTATDPYQIATATQFEGIRTNLDKYFVLTGDIDLSAIRFLPIAGGEREFTGTLDGQGHAISNWSLSTPDFGGTGLIRQIGLTGVVKDVRLVNCQLTTTGVDVGGGGGLLAGFNYGLIANCSSSGQSVAWDQVVGGLVMENDGEMVECSSSAAVQGVLSGGLVGRNSGTIVDSFATGAVSPSNDGWQMGGLAGINWGTLERCYATGNISGGEQIGGFVGVNLGVVRYCRSSGTVIGTSDDAGGFAGWTYGPISDCYAIGAVIGVDRVGGFVGEIYAPAGGGLTRCYSYGAVAGDTSVGGLVGLVDSSGRVVDSYWDTETSGQSSSADGAGKDTATMQTQATYANWDFVNVWSISANQYPMLRSDIVVAPIVTQQPLSQTVNSGDPATFTVGAIGVGTFTYQWSHNGTPIEGATDSSFTIPSVQASDAGSFQVTVTNSAGSTQSSEATLEVN